MANKHVLLAVAAAFTAVVTAFVAMFTYDQRGGSTIVIRDPIQESEVVIWIGGAVESPGVYALPAGSRLDDAIRIAGGLAGTADTSGLNLATRLEDEARIEVPYLASTVVDRDGGSPIAVATSFSSTTTPTDLRIDINSADTATLESLPGIGPVLASRIVEYREQHGPYNQIEELANVDGVSSKMVDSLRDLITADQ